MVRAWDLDSNTFGLVVIKSWLRRGVIFDRCAAKGWRIRNTQPGGIADEGNVAGLANETVGRAVLVYRDNVLPPGVRHHPCSAGGSPDPSPRGLSRYRDG